MLRKWLGKIFKVTPPAPPAVPLPGLNEAFAYNGFALCRGLLSADEAARASETLRAEVGEARIGKSICDASSRLPSADLFLFDRRIRDKVAEALGAPIKFLQVCDIQTDHNRDNWHRDGACRAFGKGDWDESVEPYRVVKIILYLDIKKAGLAVVPGSHKHRTSLGKWKNVLANYIHLEPHDDARRQLFSGKPTKAAFVEMAPGDALIFDERLLHCGRRLNAKGTEISEEFSFPKTTLAYAYGQENRHAWRFHSYFRYQRPELKFADLRADHVERLEAEGLLPSFYGKNLFEAHPEELENISGK